MTPAEATAKIIKVVKDLNTGILANGQAKDAILEITKNIDTSVFGVCYNSETHECIHVNVGDKIEIIPVKNWRENSMQEIAHNYTKSEIDAINNMQGVHFIEVFSR